MHGLSFEDRVDVTLVNELQKDHQEHHYKQRYVNPREHNVFGKHE